MAEKITIYNSYYKEIFLTTTDMYGNETPMNLSKYNDNYVVIKKNRETEDNDSYLIKKIILDNPVNGLIPIYISPEETKFLPLTNEDLPYIYMFVVIGSTVTGETREIGAYKVKTQMSGLRRWTPIDTDMSDLGWIGSQASFTYDCGSICDIPVEVKDLSGGEPFIYNCGYIVNTNYVIDSLGDIKQKPETIIDLGYIRNNKGMCYASNNK